MQAFIHQLLSGIANGGIYAIVGLALVMVYQSTNHINFAQGEIAMLSTFVAWSLINAGLSYATAALCTLILSFMFGAAIERFVIRPIKKAPPLSVVAVFIGILSIVNSLAGLSFGYQTKTFPSPFSSDAWYGSAYMSPHEVGTIFVTICVITTVYLFLYFTPLGLGMRAAALNPHSSRLVGIRVDRMMTLGWGLAAAIGAIGGMLAAPIVYLDPNMMQGILLYGFAAALLGGINNPWGAVAGGFIVGILENLVGTYVVGTELKLVVALALIIGVLTLKPSGLFGKTVVVRV
jgi:branched-chain amino acid transport system permease protein